MKYLSLISLVFILIHYNSPMYTLYHKVLANNQLYKQLIPQFTEYKQQP